jgi:hypothetical protein
MADIVDLKLYKNDKIKRWHKMFYRQFIATTRTIPSDMDGWCLVSFRRDEAENILKVYATWGCKDPMDVSRLPDLAKTTLLEEFEKQHR